MSISIPLECRSEQEIGSKNRDLHYQYIPKPRARPATETHPNIDRINAALNRLQPLRDANEPVIEGLLRQIEGWF